MKSLYLRIYLTLVAVLLAFAFGSAWIFQRQIEQERGNADAAAGERLTAIATLVHRALPPADAPREQQAEALQEWGQRLRMAMALNDAKGQRIAASELFERRAEEPGLRMVQVPLEDGRTLQLIRGWRPPVGFGAQGGPGGPGGPGMGSGPGAPGEHGGRMMMPPRRDDAPWGAWPMLGHRPGGEALLVVLVLLFFGVAAGAYPVVRRLTRRLEALKSGVERFGAGNLSHRVDDSGRDEVAALAGSFNRAAAQIESLLQSHRDLLANASHELRSPLARLKMAFAMLDEAGPATRPRLAAEINTNIAELDALVEEVLLASRLEAGSQQPVREPVELIGLAAEEAARAGAAFEPAEGLVELKVQGEERLLRRALRNLLENARRYGGPQVLLELRREGPRAQLRVCDRGPGVPEALRERIFEAFYRLPGHAEQAGGVGLGLSLVKQIAQRHGGEVRCEGREGGGSVFVFSLPTA
ncbi:sensor histidine kinase [Roseateles violae]|uniref:histidine kinase n=1 Tax=Roseateles violae TaxID=3058042 RepID=A0ABT8DUV8_9BURK|nr:HAMP domain-containing sensor histidine kinase [Pelomonas sp. PFR6]MDN3921861.1 HAMP domain-containing sensor histidine kinase [Pelomonas sp. PFR6]